MPTQPMTKFVVNDPASTEPACLYLKDPSDDQLDAVIAWLDSKHLDMVTCLEGTAIFTKTGKGKPSPAIAIQFQSRIDFDAAAAKMAELYPCPKDLTGIQLTNYEVLDQATDMPIAPIQSYELADHMDAVAAEEAALLLGVDDRTAQLEHDLVEIGATGPLPAAQSVNPDDVPF